MAVRIQQQADMGSIQPCRSAQLGGCLAAAHMRVCVRVRMLTCGWERRDAQQLEAMARHAVAAHIHTALKLLVAGPCDASEWHMLHCKHARPSASCSRERRCSVNMPLSRVRACVHADPCRCQVILRTTEPHGT